MTCCSSPLQSFGLTKHVIPSPAYTADLEEVFTLGKKDAAGRSTQDNDTVYFWADGNSKWCIRGQLAEQLV